MKINGISMEDHKIHGEIVRYMRDPLLTIFNRKE